ncbi:SUMO-interacting motif-containing protein 1 [Pseudonaja textilis]|uniref:SUMO-interacting motif-containing protein 1 n=1 Tax=Pseudonaja textilis TaxID=8673 RepID=UPI000EAA4F84|nr:SUMO-interacting motif-containing protein 1 [Pseudonaja textilis]
MDEGALHPREAHSGEEDFEGPSRLRRGRILQRRKWRRGQLSRPLDIIDLTGEDIVVRTTACNDLEIIDLTEPEEVMINSLQNHSCFAWDLKPSTSVCPEPISSSNVLTVVDAESKCTVPVAMWVQDRERSSPKVGVGKLGYLPSNSFSCHSNYSEESEGSSHTTYNSDLGSLGSPQLESDVFSFSSGNDGTERPTLLNRVASPQACSSEKKPNLQFYPRHQRPPPSLCSSSLNTARSVPGTDRPLHQANKPRHAMESNVQEQSKRTDIKIWLKTLQYCHGIPVHHPLLQNVVEKESRKDKRLKTQPIPFRRLNMVSSTMEENFFQGTLDFLMDYVSYKYYPPKDVTTFVVRQILLSPEHQEGQQEIQKDAYMLLMKIQALHPATTDTVVWDWQLLSEVMEVQGEMIPGRILFLQYMIQTLEDDFQKKIRTGVLHRSIAKAVLSCDKCFGNVKEVIKWLIAVVTGARFSQHRKLLQETKNVLIDKSRGQSCNSIPELSLNETMQKDDASIQFQVKKEAALLQRMLSIAVEVDKSPNCNATKIADVIFASLLNIPKRGQRDIFLSTMDCHLLRCKVLELIFQHNCSIPTKEPLSLTKILHFLNHVSLLLTYQDREKLWQRWDEILHQMNLLLLSYRTIVLGHLRDSVYERINLIIKAAKPKLQSNDYIEKNKIKRSIYSIQKKLCQILGQQIPSPIKEKIELLQVLLFTAMDI